MSDEVLKKTRSPKKDESGLKRYVQQRKATRSSNARNSNLDASAVACDSVMLRVSLDADPLLLPRQYQRVSFAQIPLARAHFSTGRCSFFQ